MTFHWSNPLKNTLKSMDNEREANCRILPIKRRHIHPRQDVVVRYVATGLYNCNHPLECDFMVFQRIFNAHTCLRQLRFVLNILPKLASLTCDQTQHRRFPSAHLKLHIISYYINNQKCRSEVCWRYIACCQVQIDRANTLEDYPRTHRRGFHQLNTKHQPQTSYLVHFLKFDAILWVFQRILMLLGCPFLKPQ